MSFSDFDFSNFGDKLSKISRFNMKFELASSMRDVAVNFNYENSPIGLFEKAILDGISDAARAGKFEFEISWPNNVEQKEAYSLDKELREADYDVRFEPTYNSPITKLIISWKQS